MKAPTCLTELRSWDEHGQLAHVELCRHECWPSTSGMKGPSNVWVWVCPNPRCGTAKVFTTEECRRLLTEGLSA